MSRQTSPLTLSQLAELTGGTVIGDGNLLIERVVHPMQVKGPNDLALILDVKLLGKLAQLPLQTILLPQLPDGAPPVAVPNQLIVPRPKVALAILSHIPAETLRQAVAREEAALLARVPGIGPKKAKQIVFQLKDKVGLDDVFIGASPISDSDGEVIAALTTLGYSVVEAQTALQQIPKELKGESVEEKVRLALSSLSKF